MQPILLMCGMCCNELLRPNTRLTHVKKRRKKCVWKKNEDRDNNAPSDQSLWISVPSFQFITQRLCHNPLADIRLLHSGSLTAPQYHSSAQEKKYLLCNWHSLQGNTKGMADIVDLSLDNTLREIEHVTQAWRWLYSLDFAIIWICIMIMHW